MNIIWNWNAISFGRYDQIEELFESWLIIDNGGTYLY